MKLNIRKKRFIVSFLLLLLGVFALRPYLTTTPHAEIVKSLSGLNEREAASVMKTFTLGSALVDKGRDFTATMASPDSMNSAIDRLDADVRALNDALLAMPKKSSTLTPEAQTAYERLDTQLVHFLTSISKQGQ